MATNDFLAFAADPAANVMLQTDYAATGFTPRILGFQTGTALSIQLNKVWRQASLISAMIGQFPVTSIGADMKDDGSAAGQAALLTNFTNAVAQVGGAGLAGKYLPLTGGILTGPLGINAGSNQLYISGTTGSHAIATMTRNPGLVARWEALSNNQARWTLDIADGTPETGNNLGSNFSVSRYNDAGAYLETPFSIARSTGIVQFTHPPQVNGGPLPYLPITGGTLTGALGLPLPGIYYNGTAGHWLAFDWDGSFIRGWVDGGSVVYQLAHVGWVNSLVGNYVNKGGDIIYNWFEADCNVTIDGSLFNRSTVYFSNLSDFANFTGGNWRYRQWAGNWYDAWDGASGTRIWVNGPTGTNMTLDPYANLAISGTLHVYGGRLAVGQYGSISVYHPQTSQGLWAAADGLWFGWNDNSANPQRGLLRLGNDGVLASWYGIVSYGWIQSSQWASFGSDVTVGGHLQVNSNADINGYMNSQSWVHAHGDMWCDGNFTANGWATFQNPTNVYGPGRFMVHSNQPAIGLDFVGNYGMGICINYALGAAMVFTMMDGGANPTGWLGFLNTAGVWGGYYFQTVSGRDIKKNIDGSPEFDSLAAISRIATHSYDMKENDVHRDFGFIAEEVAEQLPDAVEDHGAGPMLDIMTLIAHAYRAIAQLEAKLAH
jgi:hypothetical protein